MKMLKSISMTGAGLAVLMATQSSAGPVPGGSLPMLQQTLGWAQMMAADVAQTPAERSWVGYWRNQSGILASQVVLAQLDQKPNSQPRNTVPDSSMNPGGLIMDAPPVDPNAQFRNAATAEENLARAPQVKLNTEASYIPKLRDGEAAGVSVDYAKFESVMRRYPVEQPSSIVTVIPPIGYGGFGYRGWGSWGGWGGTRSWGGYRGWGGGHSVGFSYSWGVTYAPPVVVAPPPPCVLAAPVYYDPGCGGGISGGFFYRSRHLAVGVRF